jgi:branched-chain amino acid transport system permease protein
VSLTLQVVVSGLAAGGVYGLVAVAHSLIFRLTGIVYFALGDLISLGVFVALLAAAGTDPVTQTNAGGVRFLGALVAGFVACVAVSAAGYAVAVQPHVRRGSTIGWVASTLALGYFIRSVVEVFFTRPNYVFPDPIPFGKVDGGVISVAGASVQTRSLLVVVVAVALAGLAVLIVERTRFGRALQAIAADVEGAALVGVPVDRLVAAAFGLAGGLAALAAVVAAPGAPFGVESGATLGYKGLIAALAVGFGSPWASFGAGLALGVVEAGVASLRLGPFELGPEYRDVIPLALAVLLIAAFSYRRRAALG